MKKRIAGRFWILAVLFVLPISAMAQGSKKPDSIVFIHNSWVDALHEAQVQNKYIFVDAYATWCAPCSLMRSTTFRNSKAAAFFNANFINVEMDMERGEGPELADRWGIEAYPTLLVFDANGKFVTEALGYIGGKGLVKFGEEALRKKGVE